MTFLGLPFSHLIHNYILNYQRVFAISFSFFSSAFQIMSYILKQIYVFWILIATPEAFYPQTKEQPVSYLKLMLILQ